MVQSLEFPVEIRETKAICSCSFFFSESMKNQRIIWSMIPTLQSHLLGKNSTADS